MKKSVLSAMKNELDKKEKSIKNVILSYKEDSASNSELQETPKDTTSKMQNISKQKLANSDEMIQKPDRRNKPRRGGMPLLIIPLMVLICVLVGLGIYAFSSSKTVRDSWGPQDRETERETDYTETELLTDIEEKEKLKDGVRLSGILTDTEKESENAENTVDGVEFNISDWPLDASSLSVNDDYRKSITKKETPVSFPLQDLNVDDTYEQFLDSVRRNPIICEMMIRALKASHEEGEFLSTYPWINQFITIIDKQRDEGTGLNTWLRQNAFTNEHFITKEYHFFSLELCNLLDQADKSIDDFYGIPYVLHTDELNSQRFAILGDDTTEEKALVLVFPDGVKIGISLKDQAAILPVE